MNSFPVYIDLLKSKKFELKCLLESPQPNLKSCNSANSWGHIPFLWSLSHWKNGVFKAWIYFYLGIWLRLETIKDNLLISSWVSLMFVSGISNFWYIIPFILWNTWKPSLSKKYIYTFCIDMRNSGTYCTSCFFGTGFLHFLDTEI